MLPRSALLLPLLVLLLLPSPLHSLPRRHKAKRVEDIQVVRDGTHVYHLLQTPDGRELRFESVISYGMSEEDIMEAERTVARHYSGETIVSGTETNQIGDELEERFGGIWTVGFFSDPYGMAYTLARRAPMYTMFEVDGDAGVLVASQGPPTPSEMGRFHITRDGVNANLVPKRPH